MLWQCDLCPSLKQLAKLHVAIFILCLQRQWSCDLTCLSARVYYCLPLRVFELEYVCMVFAIDAAAQLTFQRCTGCCLNIWLYYDLVSLPHLRMRLATVDCCLMLETNNNIEVTRLDENLHQTC